MQIGAGTVGIGIPDGENGPTDANNNPVAPRLTDDFQGVLPSNSIFTSIFIIH